MWTAIIGGAATLASGAMSADAASDAAGAQNEASQAAIYAQQKARQDQEARLAPYGATGTAANRKLSTLLGLGGTPGGSTDTHDWNNPIWKDYVARGGFTGADGQTDNSADQTERRRIYAEAGLGVDSNDPTYGSLLKNITMQDIQADPVYSSGLDFGLNEGRRAINSRALAGGSYDSGATLKALARYASDYGTTKAQAGVSNIMGQRNQQYGMLSGQQGVGMNAASGQNLATSTTANNISNLTTGMGNSTAAGIVGGANAYSGLGASLGNLSNNYNNSQLLKSIYAGNSGASNNGQFMNNSPIDPYSYANNYG